MQPHFQPSNMFVIFHVTQEEGEAMPPAREAVSQTTEKRPGFLPCAVPYYKAADGQPGFF